MNNGCPDGAPCRPCYDSLAPVGDGLSLDGDQGDAETIGPERGTQ